MEMRSIRTFIIIMIIIKTFWRHFIDNKANYNILFTYDFS